MPSLTAKAHEPPRIPQGHRCESGVIVTAGSIGGLAALKTLLSSLPEDFSRPIVVVQHRTTLSAIARETRERPASPLGWFRNMGRMGKLIYRAQDDLIVYAPLLELFNPVLLLGTLFSVPAVLLQILIATIILASRAG